MGRAAEGPRGGAREARHPRQALAELAHRRGSAARARGARARTAPDGGGWHRAGRRGAGRDRARRRRGPPRHGARADDRDPAARERDPPAHGARGAEARGPAATELDRHGLERGAAGARSRCERSAGARGGAAGRTRAGAARRGADPRRGRAAARGRGSRTGRRAAGAAGTCRRTRARCAERVRRPAGRRPAAGTPGTGARARSAAARVRGDARGEGPRQDRPAQARGARPLARGPRRRAGAGRRGGGRRRRAQEEEGSQGHQEVRHARHHGAGLHARGQAAAEAARAAGKEQKKTEITVPRASKRVIRISEVITVADLARAMGVKAGDVLKKLLDMGMMATINQALDHDTAALVAAEFEHQVDNVAFDVEQMLEAAEAAGGEEKAVVRAPVVTMMGHVDHGKTSLLDAIRSTNVAEGEAGGITQHIGAYTVEVNGRQVTFLDTPGHEAFTAMRARGAKVTDIVVLVVAADDGVMPQTIEAIHHARAAEVPVVVAINKIDKHEANQEKVKQELVAQAVVPEEYGGDSPFVPVSAKTGAGIDTLLEQVLLQAEVLELKAPVDTLAKGLVIEARLDKGRGPVATVLVQSGTLQIGDAFVCGTQYGRVRAMMSDKGQRIEAAGPSTPVEILGLGGVPEAGDTFVAVQDDQKARQVAEHRRTKQREAEMAKTAKVSLDDLYQQIQTGAVKELKVVLKADVQGSVEATSDALRRLSTDDVRLNVLHGSVGGITESDVLLASASNAVVIGFNVRPEPKAAALAEREGVDIRLYTIIYEALNDVRDALEGLLEPTLQEKVLGRAEVRQTFTVSGIGQVAGCFVAEGKILRGAKARLLRDHVVVHDGRIASLKRSKEDAREVAGGYECGMSLEGYQDVKAGDVIEAYEVEQVARRLAPAAAKGAQAAE